jgi:hypothetical protein
MPLDVIDFLREVSLAYCDGIESHEDYAKWVALKATILYDYYVTIAEA